jgi:hypothetical protein
MHEKLFKNFLAKQAQQHVKSMSTLTKSIHLMNENLPTQNTFLKK